MHAIPENEAELLTLRNAVLALEESGRMSAAQVLSLNPRAPSSQPFNGSDLYTWRDLRAWADDLYREPELGPEGFDWAALASTETAEPATRPELQPDRPELPA